MTLYRTPSPGNLLHPIGNNGVQKSSRWNAAHCSPGARRRMKPVLLSGIRSHEIRLFQLSFNRMCRPFTWHVTEPPLFELGLFKTYCDGWINLQITAHSGPPHSSFQTQRYAARLLNFHRAGLAGNLGAQYLNCIFGLQLRGISLPPSGG
jgi:hypothetical protein